MNYVFIDKPCALCIEDLEMLLGQLEQQETTDHAQYGDEITLCGGYHHIDITIDQDLNIDVRSVK